MNSRRSRAAFAILAMCGTLILAGSMMRRPNDRADDVRAFVRGLPSNGKPFVRAGGAGGSPIETTSFGSGSLTSAELHARARATFPAAKGWREWTETNGTVHFENAFESPVRRFFTAVGALSPTGTVRVEIWGAGATVDAYDRRLFASEDVWAHPQELQR